MSAGADGLMTDAILIVTPETLEAKAEEVSGYIGKMKAECDKLQSFVNATTGYWIGEAGDAYRKKYMEYEPEIDNMFRRLTEHVTDLQKMANVYADTEAAAMEIAESLPADAII